MNMSEWAEKEVEISCKRENPDRKEGEFDYGCACYESALKAYKSLMEDGHSGMSFGFTKNILKRLIDGKPLTPIEDTPDIWRFSFERTDKNGNHYKTYQCSRMSSLFKDIYDDGHVEYHDIDQFVCVNLETGWTFHSGLVDRILRPMFPIIMPYIPTDQIRVYVEDFLTDPKNGDYDTVGILTIIKPNGDKMHINRYFKEGLDDYIEINEREYLERKKIAEARKEKQR